MLAMGESEDDLKKRLAAGETIEVAGKKVRVRQPGEPEGPGIHIEVATAEEAVRLSQEIDSLTQGQKEVLEEYPALREIFFDKKLSRHQKHLATLPYLRQLRDKRIGLAKQLRSKNDEIERLEAFNVGAKQFIDWVASATPKLEKNDASRLHRIVSAAKVGRTFLLNGTELFQGNTFDWSGLNTFVIQNDWAAAFDNAGDYAEGDGWNLPYDKCAFEFRISGKNMVVLAVQEDEQPIKFVPFVEFNNVWLCPDDESNSHPLFALAISEIKALSVALDAEVAVRNVVRVSEKVNRRRIEEGREPFYSYHVVTLNRRYRVGNPTSGGGVSKGKVRLHFRRGHWRHYAEHKTWVRWMLVGNPDLGFIDKEYRL